jgi:hypothetical protein
MSYQLRWKLFCKATYRSLELDEDDTMIPYINWISEKLRTFKKINNYEKDLNNQQQDEFDRWLELNLKG